MNILGIETSCDETAAAVVKDGDTLLSNTIISQIDIHREFGGVIPEVAARSHIEVILPVVDKALKEAFIGEDDPWKFIDAIAVTYGPGLQGSLLIGTLTARSLALLKNKPLYPIHHVEGHTYANFITKAGDSQSIQELAEKLPTKAPQFPLLSLTVSGGHSQLVLFEDHGRYKLLGQTQDDAVGEAFDKVAKMLGLGYPGGPAIAKRAENGDPSSYNFPISRMDNQYDFSFSGLKTAVLRHLQKLIGEDYSFPSHQISTKLSDQQIADTAASFQYIAVKTLVDKAVLAYSDKKPKSIVIAGGVAANGELRKQLQEGLDQSIEYAPPILCTDNAAMIASLAYFRTSIDSPADPFTLETHPSLSM